MPQLFKGKASSSKFYSRPSGGGPLGPDHLPEQERNPTAFPQQQQHQQPYRTLEPQPPTYSHTALQPPTPGQPHFQNLDRPPIDVAGSVHAAHLPPSPNPQQEYRASHNPQFGPQTPPAAPDQQKKGIRERLFGHSSRESVDQAQVKVHRSTSFRRREPPQKHASPTEQQRRSSAYWSSRQSSQGNLPIYVEESEGEQQPAGQYQQQLPQAGPAVPPKDAPNAQYLQHHQQSQGPPQQLHFPPPPSLHRADTDPTSSQGAHELYSGSEHSAPNSIQPTPQLNQFVEGQSDGFQQRGQQIAPQQLQQPQFSQQPSISSRDPAAQADATYQTPLYQQQPQAQQQKLYFEQQQQAQRQQVQQLSNQFPPPPQAPLQGPPTPAHHHEQQQLASQPYQAPPQPPTYQSQVREVHQPQAVRGTLQAQHNDGPPIPLPAARPLSQQHQYNPPSPLAPSQRSGPNELPPSSPYPPSSSSGASTGPPAVSVSSQAAASQNPQSKAQQKTADMPSKHPQGAQSMDGFSRQHGGGGPQNTAASRMRSQDVGRNTPPPMSGDVPEDDPVAQLQQLHKDHKELKDKYQKVKKYYFEKEAQVHTLQNTLAHQRLSQSRTSLDDSEYATRFQRLDGLIAQLSFSIRKNWESIPPWLQPGCNKDAITIGKQEMTAIGKAFISAWLVEEIFDTYFHPDLDQAFSMQLKQIQMNIRRFAPPFQSEEEEDALGSKIISWRLATIEGLQAELRSPQAHENRQKLIEMLNDRLIASLSMHLQEPAPPDLTGGVPMIIELAVGIASHLPMESRDVVIEYFMPGSVISSEVMKIESGIPPLTSPMAAELLDQADRASLRSTASELREAGAEEGPAAGQADRQGGAAAQGPAPPAKDDKRGRSMLAGIMSSRKPTPNAQGQQQQQQQQGKNLGDSGSQVSLSLQQQQPPPPGSSGGPKEDTGPPRVRMAVGVAVQIRGRNVLTKAGVYSG